MFVVINKLLIIKFIEALNIEMEKVNSATFKYLSLCPVQSILHPGSFESSVKEKVDVQCRQETSQGFV